MNEATGKARRIDALDILRGIALFGVLTVNLITAFRVSIFAQFVPNDVPPDIVDGLIAAIVRDYLELKALALFSMLFGVGLAIQFAQLQKGERPVYWLSRRMLVLFGFGLIHLILIWNGDILVEYAVAGLLVLPMLRAPNWAVVAGAGLMFALYLWFTIVGSPLALPSADWIAQHVPAANQVYASGDYAQIQAMNVGEIPYLLPLHVAIFPRTLALFLFGIFVVRSGALREPARHIGRFLGIALSCMLAGATLAGSSLANLANFAFPQLALLGALQGASTVLLATGFAAGIIVLAQLEAVRPVLAVFAPVGRMAFTCYIMQSLVFALVFFGYGLGQFAQLGQASTFAFGVIFFAAQCLFCHWWLKAFRYGPLEWAWRTLMYGRAQPMKCLAPLTPLTL